MMMLDDLRLALRQICRAMGLGGNAATVVSLIVLGIALNITALRAVEIAGIGGHRCQDQTALRSATQTELKVMRAVMVSTLKKMGDGGRRWCLVRHWVMGKELDGTGYHFRVGFAWTSPACSDVCETMVVSRSSRKMAVPPAQC